MGPTPISYRSLSGHFCCNRDGQSRGVLGVLQGVPPESARISARWRAVNRKSTLRSTTCQWSTPNSPKHPREHPPKHPDFPEPIGTPVTGSRYCNPWESGAPKNPAEGLLEVLFETLSFLIGESSRGNTNKGNRTESL